MSVLIRGGRVVDPGNSVDILHDLLLQDGKIAKLGAGLAAPPGARVIEAAGKVVCPGFIDMHVHLREPGHEYK
jgi:dihydroorotase